MALLSEVRLTNFLKRAPSNLGPTTHQVIFNNRNDLAYQMYMLKRKQRLLKRDTEDHIDNVRCIQNKQRERLRQEQQNEARLKRKEAKASKLPPVKKKKRKKKMK